MEKPSGPAPASSAHPLERMASNRVHPSPPDTPESQANTEQKVGKALKEKQQHVNSTSRASEQRTVHIRTEDNDPGAQPPGLFGTSMRSPPGIAGNAVKTTKYTLVTFIPKNLMEQFRRLFNVFWLIQCTIVLIPGLAPYSSVTTILGFSFVLGVAAVKDAWEDYQRYKADKAANATPVKLFRKRQFYDVESRALLVGDVIKVHKDEEFPADLVVISSSEDAGTLYVETSNLDGERNLKRLYALEPIKHCKKTVQLAQLNCLMMVEGPNDRLYKFNGQLRLPQNETGRIMEPKFTDDIHPINVENVCLRGARLKNTDWMIGVVVYAGMESKLQMNSTAASSKFSSIEKQLNKYIIYLFVLIFLICILVTLGSVTVHTEYLDHHYLYDLESGADSRQMQYLNFFTYLVLLNAFIPLSLVVSMELATFAQRFFMVWDDKMKTSEAGAMKNQASALNAELGQIEYVFSDKTGTLTQNKMVFKHCSIQGEIYLNPMEGELAQEMAKYKESDQTWDQIDDYLRLLVLCNDVIPQKNEKTGVLEYNSASPDEVALVQAAAANGFELLSRGVDEVVVRERGVEVTYKQVAVFEFTSDRRRMSVLIKTPDGTNLLLSKGADMVMKPLCAQNTPPDLMKTSLAQMDEFANQGYRVLLCGMRYIKADEFATFEKDFHAASTTLLDRDQALTEVYASLECDLSCVGVTCVEDKLQDEVPDTIQYLLRANVHVWILTGDKLETAINIAHSSSIIVKKDMTTAIIDGDEPDAVFELAKKALRLKRGPKGKALVIGGHALSLMCEPERVDTFVQLCKRFNVVVCARCAPVQKAEVVTLVMRRLQKISLAIGDGGNDVPMIQSADVGVGIMGNEGMQASRSSDFSIGEFRLLKRLLAVHGRYSSLRMADLIKFSFYKNVAFCTPQVVFAAYNLFSANTIHNEWIILAYNIAFTGLQPLVNAIFEKDLPEEVLELFPEAYCTAERKHPLTPLMLFEWEAHAIGQGVLFAFAVLYGVAWDGAYNDEGLVAGADTTGFLLAAMVVWAVTFKLYFMIRSFTAFHYVAIWSSVIAFYIGLAFLDGWDSVYAGESVNGLGIINRVVLGEGRSWLLLLVFVVGAALPDIVIAYCRRSFFPEQWMVLQGIDRYKGRDDLEKLSYKATFHPEEQAQEAQQSPADGGKAPNVKLEDVA